MSYQHPCKHPNCDSVVTFDAHDPRHENFGALLVDGRPQPKIVYLRCGNDHLHRYELPATDV